MNEERYIELKSVGSYLDTITGIIFPKLKNSIYKFDKQVTTHIDDCSEEWWMTLNTYDYQIVKEYKLNNSDLKYNIIK